jgi:hypothetical protein
MYPDDYSAFAQRRSVAQLDSLTQKAAQGLSAYSTLEAAVATARKFPRLGQFIVGYTIPDECELVILHIIGIPEHFTVFGDFEAFHAMYDQRTYIDLDDGSA